jgi:excisionase family DNA binding protein
MPQLESAPPTWRAHTRQQAAEHLQVPIAQVDAAIRRGDLPCVRVGKHIRIADAALRRFAGQDILE